MLERCKKKFGHQIEVVLGDACQLPFEEETFDGITVGWGIRNVYDIDTAHREACRVLKKGASFVSIDMARPQHFFTRFISERLFRSCIPLLWAILGKVRAGFYLPKSTERFLTREELKSSMEQGGFIEVMWQDLFGGNICIHWGKKP
jgi:demethylmenaquinone methyltransferase/2-methoxy-6-polyprenyl-1,4-benzoquinol methylase